MDDYVRNPEKTANRFRSKATTRSLVSCGYPSDKEDEDEEVGDNDDGPGKIRACSTGFQMIKKPSKTHMRVDFDQRTKTLSPEEISAMVSTKMKKTVKVFFGK